MKKRISFVEKRAHVRIDTVFPIKIKTEDFMVVAEAINLSCSGVYCKVNQYIPYMTQLKIALALPYKNKKRDVVYVECYGVVVRIEDEITDSSTGKLYKIAVFFNEIEEAERDKLKKYIEQIRKDSETK